MQRSTVAFDHRKQAKILRGRGGVGSPVSGRNDRRKMDFNGAIISTSNRSFVGEACARVGEIIRGKLISRVRLRDGKSERSINNGARPYRDGRFMKCRLFTR